MTSDGLVQIGAGAGRLEVAEVRRRLAGKRGRDFWRSLDELAATPEFEDLMHREFPRQASEWLEDDGLSRRRFLQLSGASLALAGLTACTKQPPEAIVPYVRQPEEVVPGRPLFFATALTLAGVARGVLAESHLGRPTKIEGNPQHPASLGATDAFAQAAVLTLYDPERSQAIARAGRIGTWSAFVQEVGARARAQQALGGEGLRFLTGAVTSPSLAALFAEVARVFPAARWHRWEPAAPHHARAAAARAFGSPLEPVYDFTRARVVLTLDADPLCEGPGAVRYARDFASRRRPRGGQPEMNRLYAVESSPTSTGTLADHRLAVPPAEVEALALALATRLGVAGAVPAAGAPAPAPRDPRLARWVAAVADDLRANAGASLVVAGEYARPAVHVLAHAINQALGNAGATVTFAPPVEAAPVDHLASLAELVRDLRAGRVETLFVLDSNPVYTAPAELGFAAALERAPLRVHSGLYFDETAERCQWHVPAAHELESWGDARAYDGTVSLIQPLIEPLYGGKTPAELLAVLLGRTDATAYELVREHWQTRLPGDFEAAWRRALHDGVVALPATGAVPAAPAFAGGAAAEAAAGIAGRAAEARAAEGADERTLALCLRPDPGVYDGRFANNAWLQELPRPLTKLTWENALLLAPATAEALGIANEDVVEIAAGARRLEVPVWVLPGHAPGAATLHLGYGRTRAGAVGSGIGANAYALRTSDALWSLPVTVRKTGGRHPLACTQNHHSLDMPDAYEAAERRKPVRSATLGELRERPNFLHEGEHGPEHLSLYPEDEYPGYAWGMAIDLSSCTGCSACVVACQSENNIPVVGKEGVARGREMHWLRIDRYFAGDLDDPAVHNQPLLCMHCEKAPCEVVCPVAATVHSDEGLNDMVYNRCVGTRYCSHNCPYKVRRFNFLKYNDERTPVLSLLRNPDVTVRMRGVMEKCTYCVQRINAARIDSKVEGRKIRDGEIVTACQQVCPTQAIVFGDVNDPQSQVSRWKAEPLNYGLLAELNTQPRTTYLAKITNPNPALAPAAPAAAADAEAHGS
ncbi:MAG TPA: TAT-variant-translocated molybdopterin oxidoreductase [Thermoanaerobaculia bacterium]|nr:TAT-variant-translocated molybdopterin oxidoreductase [Thermoanaerobaculia bacterium]